VLSGFFLNRSVENLRVKLEVIQDFKAKLRSMLSPCKRVLSSELLEILQRLDVVLFTDVDFVALH